jgi:DNA-3-methyladenine glycosylase II
LHWLEIEEKLDYEEVNQLMDRWHPYGGLVYFHLLMNRLDEAGLIADKGAFGGR